MDMLEVGALCHENKKDTQIAVVVQKKEQKHKVCYQSRSLFISLLLVSLPECSFIYLLFFRAITKWD